MRRRLWSDLTRSPRGFWSMKPIVWFTLAFGALVIGLPVTALLWLLLASVMLGLNIVDSRR